MLNFPKVPGLILKVSGINRRQLIFSTKGLQSSYPHDYVYETFRTVLKRLLTVCGITAKITKLYHKIHNLVGPALVLTGPRP